MTGFGSLVVLVAAVAFVSAMYLLPSDIYDDVYVLPMEEDVDIPFEDLSFALECCPVDHSKCIGQFFIHFVEHDYHQVNIYVEENATRCVTIDVAQYQWKENLTYITLKETDKNDCFCFMKAVPTNFSLNVVPSMQLFVLVLCSMFFGIFS